ncbi:MAG: PglZ domain-containing protein [Paramuribaculum sp.]|nr:PglZ domain-containing protein [Paramuribaculum sp.]
MSETRPKILWADDEIDLLKPHIMFLQSKGYEVVTANSGVDALHYADTTPFDLVILDENMPGITGLETLARLKEAKPHLPVIMITKSEEENIMDQAVGSKIADYLIKPVNPNQILLSIKKILHSSTLVAQQSLNSYRDEFARISSLTYSATSFADWCELYRKLVFRQTELEAPGAAAEMADMLLSQINEANFSFAKFIERNYASWIASPESAPMMSHRIMREKVMPLLDEGKKVWLIVIDNFRYDQWVAVSPLLGDIFNIHSELYCSILPTATQYCRNAIFSGLLPRQIAAQFPQLWVDEESEEGKNLNEEPLIEGFMQRMRRDYRISYSKINDSENCARMTARISDLRNNDLNAVVLNFIDMLSHARTESKAVRELASTDAAYRSITGSWFLHSPLSELFKAIARTGDTVVLTTDHGTIRVDNPVKVGADRDINSNLRYKVGKNLGVDPGKVLEVRDAAEFGLPSPGISSSYIFARGRDFFAYPTNFNRYAQHYRDTFQHGGISMQEMLVPLVTLTPKQ